MLLKKMKVSTPPPLENSVQSGSITVEAIIMFGLIAALTPVLYKHVSERRQDIENINEANTLLLLKEQTKVYIDENKDTLSVGTTIINPVDVGVDIEGYQIGIRKDSDGSINAMIAANAGGNDMKAAKVASLLGVSAGIYSAQDANRAWGINGVWAENISNYGFSSLPTGVPVVTTTYDEEDSLDMDKIFAAIEEHKFELLNTNRLMADEVCIFNKDTNEYDCRDNWEDDPIKIIEQCNQGDALSCQKGRMKNYNQTCQSVATTYKKKGRQAPNQKYTLTISETSNTTKVEYCWFADDLGYSTNEILVTKCKVGASTYDKNACVVGYKVTPVAVNRTCQNVFEALTVSGMTIPAKGTYSLTTDATGNAKNRTCYFDSTNKKGYLGTEAIDACTANTTGACPLSYNNSLNRTCLNLKTTYTADEKTLPMDQAIGVNLTTNASGGYKTVNCWFPKDSANAYEGDLALLTACNNGTDNYACRAALRGDLDIYWCEGWRQVGFTA